MSVASGIQSAWLLRGVALLDATLQPPKHELDALDWKISISGDKKRLAEHLCAFANYAGGGYFVFGIDSAGNKVGCDETSAERITGQLTNLARDAIEPAQALLIAFDKLASPPLLYVHVKESLTKPVHLKGKNIDETFVRSGATTRRASRPEVGNLLLHSRTPKWEELYASPLVREGDVIELLDAAPLFQLMDKEKPRSDQELMRWLEESRFVIRMDTDQMYVTNLGAISAARSLKSFPDLMRKAPRVISYKGVSKASPSREQEGARGYAVGFIGLMRYLDQHLPQTEEVGGKGIRRRKNMYPPKALRELVANSLIHQDFSIAGSGPMVEIYDDRVEISNPGQLLPSKQLHRLIGTQPESRNELLARAFRLFNIVEERGSGLVTAGLQVEQFRLPPIQFRSEENAFKVTLLRQ